MKNKILTLIVALSLVATTTVISFATDDDIPKSIKPIFLMYKLTPNK
ncbi:hypothetical protein R9X47_05455 [Wukongibacter baidiensis]